MSAADSNSAVMIVDVAKGDAFQEQIQKTRFCRYYPLGKCTMGNTCRFAHTSRELRKAPDLSKTSMCKMYKKGLCTKSRAECPFAHGAHELRMTSTFQAKRADDLNHHLEACVPCAPVKISPSLADASNSGDVIQGSNCKNEQVNATGTQSQYGYESSTSFGTMTPPLSPCAMYNLSPPLSPCTVGPQSQYGSESSTSLGRMTPPSSPSPMYKWSPPLSPRPVSNYIAIPMWIMLPDLPQFPSSLDRLAHLLAEAAPDCYED